MEVTKKYETDTTKPYADTERGQVVSRSLFAVVERDDMPLDSGFGEAEIIEVVPADGGEPQRVRIDEIPQDTIARSPDEAARAATAMQSLSHGDNGPLNFRAQYLAD
jgi:hypothetical protein